MNAVLEYINWMGKGFVGFAGPMLVQSSVLIIILLIVDLLLKKKVRAVFRYWLWMLVLVKLVLPIWLSSPVSIGHLVGNELQSVKISMLEITAAPRVTEPVSIETGNREIIIPQKSVSEPAVIQPKIIITPISWQGVVFVIWAGVAVVMVLLLLQRVVFVCGLVAQAKEANALMNDTLKYCCGQMGVKGTIGLKVSANATSPAVCGLFRPVILVPENLGASLGAEHLRTVLLHELAHIKRGDLWVNLVQTLLQIIYFYNPPLWLANAMIRRVREQAVDEAVLVAMGERAQQYPETLLNVAKLAFKRPMLSLRLIGVVESKSALSGRIKHILGRPIPKNAKLGIWGLAAVLIFGALLLPMAKGEEHQRALKGIAEKLNISDKAGELIIKSLYMEPPEGKKIIGNYVNLLVEVANNSPKGIFLGFQYYADSGTVAVFFSPGATGTTQIREIPANWRGKVEYPIHYARFVKNGYIQVILAKCHSNQLKESKSMLFLPDDAEILYEKKYPIDLSENAKTNNTTTGMVQTEPAKDSKTDEQVNSGTGEDSQKSAGQVGAAIEEAAVNKADEKKKTEGTSEDSVKPRVISIRPPSGSQMALISELHIVFDQPMVADKFRIVDPVLKDRPYMSMLSRCGVLYSQVVYDADNYEFIIPLALPPNWNGLVEFNGFTTVKGVESEPIKLDYSTLREPFSTDLLKRFEKARESEELKTLIQNVKTKRSSLKSLSEVVHTSYDYPKQELADKRQADMEHNKERSNTATFKIQGDRQFYTDISEEMKGPFYIGSDGEKCWFYNSFKKEGKLVMAEFDEINVKKISICNPFCISETDAATAIKKNNLEYIGVGVRDGRRCYSVRSWSADLNMDRATCIAKLWWIDAETYMVSEIISDLGHSILSRRFVYKGVNQTISDSEFRPDFVKGIAPKQPEPLGEGYNMRFINVRDGSCGRMNVRWGKQGNKGTSDSGLSGL